MAIVLVNEYPGRVDPVTTDTPYGSFKNETPVGADNGTPLERRWANDWQGFSDALLQAGQVVANGELDTATDSQRLQVLQSIIGVGRSYDTKAEAALNLNTGVMRLTILDLDDAPFERIADIAPAEEKFQDAAGQFWGIPGTNYYDTQRERWRIDQLQNLPLFDTIVGTDPGYASREAVRDYAAQQSQFDILDNDLTTLNNEITYVAGEGDAQRSTGLLLTVRGTFPNSGQLILTGTFTSRCTREGNSISFTVELPDGTEATAWASNRGGRTMSVTARAVTVLTGAPGTNITTTSTVSLQTSPNSWVDRQHTATLLPA